MRRRRRFIGDAAARASSGPSFFFFDPCDPHRGGSAGKIVSPLSFDLGLDDEEYDNDDDNDDGGGGGGGGSPPPRCYPSANFLCGVPTPSTGRTAMMTFGGRGGTRLGSSFGIITLGMRGDAVEGGRVGWEWGLEGGGGDAEVRLRYGDM